MQRPRMVYDMACVRQHENPPWIFTRVDVLRHRLQSLKSPVLAAVAVILKRPLSGTLGLGTKPRT